MLFIIKLIKKDIIGSSSNAKFIMNKGLVIYQRKFLIYILIKVLIKSSLDIYLKSFYLNSNSMKLYFC